MTTARVSMHCDQTKQNFGGHGLISPLVAPQCPSHVLITADFTAIIFRSKYQVVLIGSGHTAAGVQYVSQSLGGVYHATPRRGSVEQCSVYGAGTDNC